MTGHQSAASPPAAEHPDAGTIRFCAFADIHYYPGIFPHDSREWLERILDRAVASRCSLVIHMGDLTHAPAECRDYVDFYNDFAIPCRHTIGNHDDDGNTHQATLDAYRLECGHYHFDMGGFRFIVTDTNYCLIDGRWVHYSEGNYYAVASANRLNVSRVPPFELEWLEDVIENSPHPCVVTSHASFERPVCGSPDGEAVRAIFNKANARHPGRVRIAINGHHHCDNMRILDGIVYLDLNSASYAWFDEAHTSYPAGYTTRWRLANHTVMWDDPLSAVITMTHDGFIGVEGMRSRFHLGVSPELAKRPAVDPDGRRVTPSIKTFSLRCPLL